MIEEYDINTYYDEIVNMYNKAIDFYKIDYNKVSESLENRESFIELKINSLYASQTLDIKQFKSGSYSDLTPKYNKNIYAFDDINVLLNTVIKNGENVYLMGDIPEYKNPGHRRMRRTPGIQMAARIGFFISLMNYLNYLEIDMG